MDNLTKDRTKRRVFSALIALDPPPKVGFLFLEVLDVRLNTYEDVIVLDELTIEFLDPKEQN